MDGAFAVNLVEIAYEKWLNLGEIGEIRCIDLIVSNGENMRQLFFCRTHIACLKFL